MNLEASENVLNVMICIIGASLSEPHTSGTALRKCVNVRMCLLACLWPYTVNFKRMFKYFPKIPHALCAGLLPEHSVDTVVEMAQV